MGTFDISRINFDKKKHYTSVRMQQGRVLTDDDWNENERIDKEIQRVTNSEIIGSFGTSNDGFKIENLRLDSGLINFDILPGTLYLGGLRLELEEMETYRLQKDWLQQPALLNGSPDISESEQYDLVYLETWQQAVSAVEDSSLFEVALGGPDTTTRVRNMRRVLIASGIGQCSCVEAWNKLVEQWQAENKGTLNKQHERIADIQLKVTFLNTGLPDDLCSPSAAGGYLGAENQAIRVQLIDNNHFTWGFDNAAPFYKVTISADGKTVHVITDPKDQYHWPLSNQVVEILPWSAVLSNGEKVAAQQGHLTKVESSYDLDSGEFTIVDSLPADFGADWKSRANKDDLDDQDPAEYFYMRIWNRGDDLSSDSKINITFGTPQLLGHTGLQITITGNDAVASDFWVIAARPETPNLVVPWELEHGLPPHGVRRFFAPLALIQWMPSTFNEGNLEGKIIHDCRKKFHPLTEQGCCCTFTVGDGKQSQGDFNSIQEAVDNLPGAGGKICVLAGEHIANVSILNRKQIRISGCGEHSIVRPSSDKMDAPIFLIQNSQKIQIDNLTLMALDGIAVEVNDTKDSKVGSEKITIKENQIIAGIHAIRITATDIGIDNCIDILYNQIGMMDKPIGKAAIFSIADDVLIERNRIVVIPAPNKDDPDDPRNPDNPGDKDPFDPCRDPRLSYVNGFSLAYYSYSLIRYVVIYNPSGRFIKGYQAEGGIQIGGTSERVRILENEIIGGKGNGITLGHLTQVYSRNYTTAFSYNDNNFEYSPLYEIIIERNKIFQMGLSGISALLYGGESSHLSIVNDISIYRNHIRYCTHQLPERNSNTSSTNLAFGGIILNDCENGNISENRIEENGRSETIPVCGIYIFYGEKIIISTNYIVKNGLPITDNDTPIIAGARGGIVIKMSFKAADFKNVFDAKIPSFDGIPAVKLIDNIVEQPLGHALFIMAFGPVSAIGNQFTSLSTDKTNMLSLFASSVLIFNLGVSKDLLLIGFQNMANSNSPTSDGSALSTSYLQLLQSLQYLPNGKVMFSGNQTTLDMRSASINFGISSQLICSLDDIAFNNNQSELAGFLSLEKGSTSFDLMLFNTMLIAATIRSNDNRFSDGLALTFYSLFSYGYMNTALGNQSTHCLMTFGTLRSIYHNIILIDDLCNDQKQYLSEAMAVPVGKDY